MRAGKFTKRVFESGSGQMKKGAAAESTGAPFCAALKAAALHLSLEAWSWV
jgi:hypothetical protein